MEGNISQVNDTLTGNISPENEELTGIVSQIVGITPQIHVGTIETLNPTDNAYVELDESSTKINPILNFGIPKGNTGEQGIQGEKGDKGDKGNQGYSLNYNWDGTSLGIKREDEQNYTYTNLKGDQGDKGDPGAIKFLVVDSLPATGADDTIYLVPITPDTSGNNYAEYIYINNAWELLGKIGVQVDLTDYVKNTDYATSSKGGVVKVSVGDYGLNMDNGVLKGVVKTYSQYGDMSSKGVVAKGTLENVITGKDLTTKAYVDGLVGDIDTALDSINGEVIS